MADEGRINYEIGVELFAKIERLEEGLRRAQVFLEREAKRVAEKAATAGKRVGESAGKGAREKIVEEINKPLPGMGPGGRPGGRPGMPGMPGMPGGETNTEFLERVFPRNRQKMQAAANKSAGRLGAVLGKALKGVTAIAAGDAILEGIVEGIKNKEKSIAEAIGDSIAGMIHSVPIVGPVGELLGMVFDELTFGNMSRERDMAESRAEAERRRQQTVAAEKRMPLG